MFRRILISKRITVSDKLQGFNVIVVQKTALKWILRTVHPQWHHLKVKRQCNEFRNNCLLSRNVFWLTAGTRRRSFTSKQILRWRSTNGPTTLYTGSWKQKTCVCLYLHLLTCPKFHVLLTCKLETILLLFFNQPIFVRQ